MSWIFIDKRNASSLCVLSDINSAVILSFYVSVCYNMSAYRYLGDGGTDRSEILHDSTYRSRTQSLRFSGWYPQRSHILGLNFGHLIDI